MKKQKLVLNAMIVIIAAAITLPAARVWATYYPVRELITLGNGGAQQREFTVYDAFSFKDLAPVEGFVIIARGSADTNAGVLTITVSADPTMDYGAYVDFALVVLGYNLDSGPFIAVEQGSTPFAIETDIKFDTSLAVMYAGVLITGFSRRGDVERPVPFTVTFELEDDDE